MKIHLLSGFLGSGKTTAIEQACRFLSGEGVRMAVITNDQGSKLVDGEFFKRLGIPSGQVVNGCFCCHFDDLDQQIRSLSNSDQPELIFAESVGSCTDIVATVLKPLRQYRPEIQPTLSIFADARLLQLFLGDTPTSFDPTVRYIYFKQLEEARIVVVSKMDLLIEQQSRGLRQMIQHRYEDKIVLYQNSFEKDHIARWLKTLDMAMPDNTGEGWATLPSLDIDYDRYGEGEARLAWLDQELELAGPPQDAQETVRILTENIYKKINSQGWPIGHLKFLLNGTNRINFTAAAPTPPAAFAAPPTSPSTLLVNARVQTDPATLSRLVAGRSGR